VRQNLRILNEYAILSFFHRTLAEMYGSVYELVLFKITHEEERVIVQGEFLASPGQPEMPFAVVMPRVDGPLDCFL